MKQDLVDALKLGVVPIRFRKRDGSVRDMRATLVPELIGIESYSIARGPEHVQCVWDVDKEQWRSFRWDSLIEDQADVA